VMSGNVQILKISAGSTWSRFWAMTQQQQYNECTRAEQTREVLHPNWQIILHKIYSIGNRIAIPLDLNVKCQQEENIQDVIHHEQLLTEDTSDDICNCWTLLLAMPPLPMWRSV
jgi:hypothetical protein